MSTSMTRHGVRTLLASFAVAALAGCTARDDNAATSDTSTAPGAVAARGDTNAVAGSDTAADASNRKWTDGQIVAFAAAANTGEIQENTVAAQKATNASVKAFARQMITDHKAMLAEGKALAAKAKITPDTTKDDVTDLMKDSREAVKDLGEKQAGKDWDEDYIEHQIDEHKKVLEKLQDAQKSATNADLKAMLTKATGKVQEHLTKAQDIKDNKLKS